MSILEQHYGEENVLKLSTTNAACDVLGDAKTLAKFFIGKFRTRTELEEDGKKRFVGKKINKVKVCSVDECFVMHSW